MPGFMPPKAQFTEDDLLVFTTRVIERATRYKSYGIEPCPRGVETVKGYDVLISGSYQMYFQFKVGTYVHSPAKSKFIKARSAFTFDDTLGVLHFPLRQLAPSHKSDINKLQHNILFRLSNMHPGRVCYVSPTFTDSSLLDPLALPWQLYSGPSVPFRFVPQQVKVGPLTYFAHEVPFLRNMVSIFPHAPVKTHKHHYVYNFADEVSFHSEPEAVPRSNSFLSFLTSTAGAALVSSDADGWESLDQMRENTSAAIRSIFGDLQAMLDIVPSIDAGLQRYADAAAFAQLSPVAQRRIFNQVIRFEFDIYGFTLHRFNEELNPRERRRLTP